MPTANCHLGQMPQQRHIFYSLALLAQTTETAENVSFVHGNRIVYYHGGLNRTKGIIIRHGIFQAAGSTLLIDSRPVYLFIHPFFLFFFSCPLCIRVFRKCNSSYSPPLPLRSSDPTTLVFCLCCLRTHASDWFLYSQVWGQLRRCWAPRGRSANEREAYAGTGGMVRVGVKGWAGLLPQNVGAWP